MAPHTITHCIDSITTNVDDTSMAYASRVTRSLALA